MHSEQNIAAPSSTRKRKIPRRIDEHPETEHIHSSLEEQERVTTFYPLIDSLLEGLQSRFSQETCDLINAVGDIIKLKIPPNIDVLVSHFNISVDDLKAEIHLLKGLKIPFQIEANL